MTIPLRDLSPSTPRRLRGLALACAVATVAVAVADAAAQTLPISTETMTITDPLYAAFGASRGIQRLSEDFVDRMAGDARVGAFFKDTNLKELKRQIADQFCVVTGGPCRYEGNDMKNAHAAMRIGKADFNRVVELLQASMDHEGIAFADQNRLLARLAPMHREIVNAR